MFFVLPIRSDTTVRRWPVWTLALIATSLTVWSLTLAVADGIENDLPEVAEEAATLLSRYPELEPDVSVGQLLVDNPRAMWKLRHPEPGITRGGDVALARARLAELSATASSIRARDLRSRFAYGRERTGPLRALMSQFTHGSWLHVLGNMWFLWLLGVALEDRLGRWLFPLLYLMGGAAAGFLHRLASPVPGIGASGAIAAIMGAFAILLPTASIQLRLAAVLPIPVTIRGRFGALVRVGPLGFAWLRLPTPAWLVLFLWVARELWSGATVLDSGVAHWAHVGGFVFGVVVAVLLRLTGWDASLDRAIEDAGARHQGPRLLEASALIDEGKPGIAIVRLRALRGERGYSPIDVNLELLRAAISAGSRRDELSARAALLEAYLDSGGPSRELFEETRARGLAQELPAALIARLEPRARSG